MTFNLNSGYGQFVANQVAAAVGPNFGQVLVVAEDSDNAQIQNMLREIFVTDTQGRVRLFKTLEAAYDAAISNNNDIILLTAHSTHAVSTGIAWSKNRIHVIGMDGGDHSVQQGAKVELSGAVDSAYVIKNTGVRNSFRNIKFIQSSTHANALTVFQFAGEGNVYKDCSFVFGVANNLGGATTYEVVLGEDAGTFKSCSFGTDVLKTSAARAVMAIDAITGAQSADGAKSNRIIDCEFVIMSSSATAHLVRLIDTAGAKFLNRFINPSFIAVINNTNSAAAITNAIASASGFVEGSLVFEYPRTANCTNGCAGVTDKVVVTAPALSTNAWEGGTPA